MWGNIQSAVTFFNRTGRKVEIVSSPENDFTVKYVLTFNRTNNISCPI